MTPTPTPTSAPVGCSSPTPSSMPSSSAAGCSTSCRATRSTSTVSAAQDYDVMRVDHAARPVVLRKGAASASCPQDASPVGQVSGLASFAGENKHAKRHSSYRPQTNDRQPDAAPIRWRSPAPSRSKPVEPQTVRVESVVANAEDEDAVEGQVILAVKVTKKPRTHPARCRGQGRLHAPLRHAHAPAERQTPRLFQSSGLGSRRRHRRHRGSAPQ